MNTKSKSQRQSVAVQHTKQFQNFVQFRKKNLLRKNFQNQQQPHLCISQITKTSPLNICRAYTNQRKQKTKLSASQKKQQIKQKIKDRIKAQIEKLLQRNTFSIKKLDKGQKNQKIDVLLHSQPTKIQENVSIVGSCVPIKKQQQSLTQKQKQQKRRQDIVYFSFRKSVLLDELPFTSRKVKSSLEKRVIQKQQPNMQTQVQRKMIYTPIYSRSMSTDIRIRSKNRVAQTDRKGSQSQLYHKFQRKHYKEDQLMPWIINSPNNFQQQYHF